MPNKKKQTELHVRAHRCPIWSALIAIYAPLIYTAPYATCQMRADPLYEGKGRGLGQLSKQKYCMENPYLVLNNPARQQYRYTSFPIEAAWRPDSKVIKKGLLLCSMTYITVHNLLLFVVIYAISIMIRPQRDSISSLTCLNSR